MDSEVVLHLMARTAHLGLEKALWETFSALKGAYSLLLMTQDTMVAVRDPDGFRPLCLGKLNNGGWDRCLRNLCPGSGRGPVCP